MTRADMEKNRGPTREEDEAEDECGKILRLEIDSFKSYKGHHIVGPFKNFTG